MDTNLTDASTGVFHLPAESYTSASILMRMAAVVHELLYLFISAQTYCM